jgi:hypothetical protein
MSYVTNLEYKKNENNEVTAAIYPLKQIIEDNDRYLERLGGSKNVSSENIGTSRFEGLGVPVGLYLSKKQINDIDRLQKNPKIHKGCNVIDEEQFNRLLEKIVRKSKHRTSMKRRAVSKTQSKKNMK